MSIPPVQVEGDRGDARESERAGGILCRGLVPDHDAQTEEGSVKGDSNGGGTVKPEGLNMTAEPAALRPHENKELSAPQDDVGAGLATEALFLLLVPAVAGDVHVDGQHERAHNGREIGRAR